MVSPPLMICSLFADHLLLLTDHLIIVLMLMCE